MFKKVLLVILAILLVIGVSTALVYLIDFRQDSNEEIVDTPDDSGSIDSSLTNTDDDVNQSFDLGLSLSLNYSSVNLYYNGVASDGTTLPSCITLTPNFYPSTSYFSGNVVWTSFVLDEDGEIVSADLDSPSNYVSYIDVYGTMGRTYFADKEQTGTILVICSCDGYSSSCILNIYCANNDGYVECNDIHYSYNASMDVYTSSNNTFYVYFDTAFECSFPSEYSDGIVSYGAVSEGSGGLATSDLDYICPLYDSPTIYNDSGYIRFDFYKNEEIDVSKNSFQIWFTLTEKENHLHVHEYCCATCYLNVLEYSSGSSTGERVDDQDTGSSGDFGGTGDTGSSGDDGRVEDQDTGSSGDLGGTGDTGSGTLPGMRDDDINNPGRFFSGAIGDPTSNISLNDSIYLCESANLPIFNTDSSISLNDVSLFGFNTDSVLYVYDDSLYSLSLYSFDNYNGETYSEIVYYYSSNIDIGVCLSLPLSITFSLSNAMYCLNTYIDMFYIC